MKTVKRYTIQIEIGSGSSTRSLGGRLVERARAQKILKFLKARGCDGYIAPWKINI